MKEKIRWGILGCGRIARKFAADLQYVQEAELVAVGSRSRENAAAFAADIPVKQQYASYEALANDPDVDIIYVATPHNLHHENTLLCLSSNKAVLCEKPFAINAKQAAKMISLAKENQLFLMEALWTKFMPHYIKVKEMVNAGKIGTVKTVLANFGFRPWAPIPQRLFDPELGGGTIMDIGIYNIFMALSFLGKPDSIEAAMTPAVTGVDEQCSVLFKYNNGAMAQLFSSFFTSLGTEADICGDAGRIRLTSRFYEPSTVVEFYPGTVDTKQVIPYHKEPGYGYQFEIRHVCDCLKQGLTESPVMSHSDTLLLMETLDTVRKKAGVTYPADNGLL
jgi:predicted dehydrogenase